MLVYYILFTGLARFCHRHHNRAHAACYNHQFDSLFVAELAISKNKHQTMLIVGLAERAMEPAVSSVM